MCPKLRKLEKRQSKVPNVQNGGLWIIAGLASYAFLLVMAGLWAGPHSFCRQFYLKGELK
jgi:hypothetical protein